MLKCTLAGATVIAMLFLACGDGEKEKILTSFEEDYFDALFRFRPTMASSEGIHQFAGRLEDFSPLRIGRRVAELQRSLSRLLSLRQKEMPAIEETDAAVIEYALRAEMLDLMVTQTWQSDASVYFDLPITSLHALRTRTYAPASERLKAAIISLHETDAVMAAARANVASTSRPAADKAIAKADRLLDLMNHELPKWGKQAAGVDMRLSNTFDAALGMARETVVETRVWMARNLSSAADQRFALGRRNLAMKLLFDGMAETPLDTLAKTAQENLNIDLKAFEELARSVDSGKPAAALANMPGEGAATPAALVERLNQELGRIRQFLDKKALVSIPAQYTLHAQQTPSYLRTPAAPMLSSLPPLLSEGDDAGALYVTARQADWNQALRAEYSTRLTPQELKLGAIRHALPGEYLHSVRAKSYPTRAGRAPGTEMNLKGWGSYAEQMMVEEGYGADDPMMRLTQLRRALLDDCRLVAALGLHTEEMSFDEAVSLFRAKSYLGPELARLEVTNLACGPEPAYGALGKMMILKLREDYRRLKGPEYSLREFHDAFLDQGMLPVGLIRRAMGLRRESPAI